MKISSDCSNYESARREIPPDEATALARQLVATAEAAINDRLDSSGEPITDSEAVEVGAAAVRNLVLDLLRERDREKAKRAATDLQNERLETAYRRTARELATELRLRRKAERKSTQLEAKCAAAVGIATRAIAIGRSNS